ncbi:MAG: DUF3011 domain-containing protein [Thermomonas sp.]|uniref:DUF3011 domain-containing protein n=1 Tax=Thermomonas sp. TaxID=1971895 RepID=UPI001D1E2CF5|nr:DUF3011 domain-containing protein [Thermomonas sp.]MBZ0088239.1 DUF3011 domain-containing protein [Thermomonas sp.]MCO5054045.1 DUF3011 domain-containing protein [Thermomonas sp.]
MSRPILAAVAPIALLLAGVLASAPASAQNYGYGNGYDNVIRCESIDGRSNQCYTGGGRAELLRQVSNSPCIEGRSWGQRNDSIWVAQGCRADFRISGRRGYGDYGGYGGVVRCESHDGRYNRCAVPGRGRPELVRQISNSPCVEGRTWGADRDSVWVNNGCRGEFANRYTGGGWGNSGYGGREFRCESINGRTQECAANVRAGVQLIRQLSNAPCIQGRSWGYGRIGVWVSQGCRAEFRSY